MSTVILAEKPSQALAYASALKQSTKKDGYFEIKDPIFADETFITFGFGHLVELSLANVPKLVLRVLKKKRNRQKLLQRVHY
ncbi:hypothetical protein [Enterococcus faecalis]|uniref:hypothetical protein n=1 Tax=Enterococcus faecalis TaxID=1351 RepID=UPI001F49AC1F|nr:hypothetical protein [Enterococcus faecalis]MDT2056218.1 hypothetical protein [Enterococcus faecalis]MDT2149693.1 hypothetical protein [Enterococcus faecalis]WGL03081.1 hypothetical protein N7M47_15040 [Enterococcus faecalis]